MATFRENFVNFFRGPRDEYETPPPPQARPDVRPPTPVGRTAADRYRVEEGRITQERPGRLDTSGATAPREALPDREKAIEIQEALEAVRQGLTDIRAKEQEILENRYGRGILGVFRGFNQFLHETDLGRTVKIGGKIIGGITMATCAGFLAGTPGIIFSPALAILGKKYAISGAIEAFRYFGGMRRERDPQTGNISTQIGGRERLRRLDMEAGRARRAGLEQFTQNAAAEYAAGRLTAEEFRTIAVDTIRDIQQNEENILRNDREYEDIRKSNQRVRGLVSTGATVALSLLTDIPFGIQDLDKDGIFHTVRGALDGIKWVQGDAIDTAKNWMGQFGGVRELVAGVGSNAANLAGTTEQFWQLAGGIGVAMTGLAASTMRELGAFAQGSRARIRELLSENVRIEDGVVPSATGRPTTTMERRSRPTTGPEARPTTTIARPTTTMERTPTTAITRPTTGIERPPEGPVERTRPTTTMERTPTTAITRPTTGIERPPEGPVERARATTTTEATTAAVERAGRFVPLSGKEIQDMPGAAQELRTELLNRIGVENAPLRAQSEQFTASFGEWLTNASADAVEQARIFLEDSLRNYERVSTRNEPRRVALQGALEQIATHVRERATSGGSANENRATTTKGPEARATTSSAEQNTGQLGSLRGNLKIESFFESGNALFKKDLLRLLQGVSADASVDASGMGLGQWIGSLDSKQRKRLDSYLERQQKAAETNKGNYTGEEGTEKTYQKNLESLKSLQKRVQALEKRTGAT